MKAAIMQPYFFPYLGYFSLIKHTDRFILLDTVQFIKRGWIERNRVLNHGEGWTYIKVPLERHSRNIAICDIVVRDNEDWRIKILAKLRHYKKQAPYFNIVMELCESAFSGVFEDIVSLNVAMLKAILGYLEIEKSIDIFSELDINIEKPRAPDEWCLNICKAIGNVDEYWNPSGGKSFYDCAKYERCNIKLRFHEVALEPYNQNREGFEPGLSILDVMMFNSVQEVNKMLDNYTLC